MGTEVARVVNRCNDAKETCNLDLRDCDLTSIPDALYMLMSGTELKSCCLAENFLKKIPPKFFMAFSSLTLLELSHNSLSNLPEELSHLSQLNQLNLSHNQFTEVPVVLYNITSVENINLSHNQIKEIDAQRLQDLPNLKDLNVQDNPLSPETYSSLTSLTAAAVDVHLTPQDPQLDSVD